MSDGTTTTGRREPDPREAGVYPSGLRLGERQEQVLRGWPLERIRPKSVALGVRSLIAEVDALRERVAELDVMLGQACEAVNWLLDQDWPKDMDPGPGIRTDLAKWLAALAQAGEGGAA